MVKHQGKRQSAPRRKGGWSLLRFVGRLFRFVRTSAVVVVLTLSLALNVGLLFSGKIIDLASSAVEMVTGKKTVPAKRAASSAAQKATAKQATRSLAIGRFTTGKRIAALTSRNAVLTATLATQAAQVAAARKHVGDASKAISRRAGTMSARSVSSMGAQAIPWLGTAAIVGLTAWELNELCGMVKDMKTLEAAVGLSEEGNEEKSEVCGMKVPTTEEVWATVKSSPETAWNAASGVELPEVDWTAYRISAQDGFASMYESTSSVVGSATSATVDAVGGAYSATLEGVQGGWSWFFGEDETEEVEGKLEE